MQVPALVVLMYLSVISVCMTVTWRAEDAAFLCNHTSCLALLQSDHELSWNVAQHKCNDLDGGDLVSIDMVAQVNQVVNFVRNHSSISFEVWVGLRKDASSDCKGGSWPSLIFEVADSLLPLPGPNCSLKEDQCLSLGSGAGAGPIRLSWKVRPCSDATGVHGALCTLSMKQTSMGRGPRPFNTVSLELLSRPVRHKDPCFPDPCTNSICYEQSESFECDCTEGYKEFNDTFCEDINECNEVNYCESSKGPSFCVNEDGGYFCECTAGYTLHASGLDCLDIDECLSDEHACDQMCNNTRGSYTCGCKSGYTLDTDKRGCTSVSAASHSGKSLLPILVVVPLLLVLLCLLLGYLFKRHRSHSRRLPNAEAQKERGHAEGLPLH